MVDRDTVVNRLCSVVVPPLFVYIGLLCILGSRLANQLLNRDTYCENQIKVRTYGIVQTCFIVGFMAVAIGYFSLYKTWDMAVFFAVALLGYSWIKYKTYSVHLEYTHRHIRFCSRRKTLLIPFENVTKMCWETRRGSIAYVLAIYCNSGATLRLSSSDFIGLKHLKSTYDSRN